MGIKRLMVKGDALFIVRQVQGTWACKNSKLLQWLHEVKLLIKDFEAIQIQHISRQHNKEADNMTNSQFEVMVGAIKFKEPLFQGQETMEDILYFLETGECPKHLERVQRHRLVRKALSYQLIGEHLYHKVKDLVLRRVPLVKEIEKILMSCHDGVCGGHFAQEITSKKILQADFVWPSLHRDVQHWCKACKACQQAGDRKLSYGPRFPIFAYGPLEKWAIDAIGPLPRTSTDKQYILTATDYMTRWAEAASVARITAADVSKFVLDYICSRFGTPLEILSDRGPGFTADFLDALLENLSIKHVHPIPYYPQCNGLVEKTNGVLCKIITKHWSLRVVIEATALKIFSLSAFRRATGKAGGGLVLVNPEGEVVMKEQVTLDGSTSNNEAEYDILISGLKICLAQKIQRLMVKGDALLIVKQILGIWACKNERLKTKVTSIRKIFNQFEEVQLYHIPRKENEDADLLAQQAVSNQDKAHMVIAAIALKDPQYAGMESLTPVVNYILEGEFPKEFIAGNSPLPHGSSLFSPFPISFFPTSRVHN
ncbi:hypothetical protein L7F22_039619 [Adiantum nelumboides]|nr:hypothetical protein [Adiantum nelumboides]